MDKTLFTKHERFQRSKYLHPILKQLCSMLNDLNLLRSFYVYFYYIHFPRIVVRKTTFRV